MDTQARVVILADDEKHLRMLAARPLAKAGFTVVEAVDGEDALEALIRYAPIVHALVTDVCMPGEINGLELACMARKLLPNIDVLVSSGTVTPAPGVLPEGGRFLRKPYNLPDLNAEVSILAEHAFRAGCQPAVALS